MPWDLDPMGWGRQRGEPLGSVPGAGNRKRSSGWLGRFLPVLARMFHLQAQPFWSACLPLSTGMTLKSLPRSGIERGSWLTNYELQTRLRPVLAVSPQDRRRNRSTRGAASSENQIKLYKIFIACFLFSTQTTTAATRCTSARFFELTASTTASLRFPDTRANGT